MKKNILAAAATYLLVTSSLDAQSYNASVPNQESMQTRKNCMNLYNTLHDLYGGIDGWNLMAPSYDEFRKQIKEDVPYAVYRDAMDRYGISREGNPKFIYAESTSYWRSSDEEFCIDGINFNGYLEGIEKDDEGNYYIGVKLYLGSDDVQTFLDSTLDLQSLEEKVKNMHVTDNGVLLKSDGSTPAITLEKRDGDQTMVKIICPATN